MWRRKGILVGSQPAQLPLSDPIQVNKDPSGEATPATHTVDYNPFIKSQLHQESTTRRASGNRIDPEMLVCPTRHTQYSSRFHGDCREISGSIRGPLAWGVAAHRTGGVVFKSKAGAPSRSMSPTKTCSADASSSAPNRPCERIWHTSDSQVQTLALAFRLKTFQVVPSWLGRGDLHGLEPPLRADGHFLHISS